MADAGAWGTDAVGTAGSVAGGTGSDASEGAAGAGGYAGSDAGGQAGAGGAAGTGAVSGTGGTGACSAPGVTCSADGTCCSFMCGSIGALPNDCATPNKCAQCRGDWFCKSTERCDDCLCQEKLVNFVACNEDSDCKSSMCGPTGAAATDCATANKCAQCRGDYHCASTERCDDCACSLKVVEGAACNEDSDCQLSMCGPGWAIANDCATYNKCARCRADYQCAPTERCDGCLCVPKELNGATCNEDSDCKSAMCGPGLAGANDCTTTSKCAACRGDGDCAGNERCDGCTCQPKLPTGSTCNEPSDCTTWVCTAGKCA